MKIQDLVAELQLMREELERADPVAAERVRTYANRRNPVSQKALTRLGFTVESQSDRGFRYVINRQALLKRLEGW